MKFISKTDEDGYIVERLEETIEDQNTEIESTITVRRIYNEGEKKDRWYSLNIKAYAHTGTGLEVRLDLDNLAPSELKRLGKFLVECSKEK